MKPSRGVRSGFTLTEIMMAVAILGLGMIMIATIFPVALDQSRRSEEMTKAALCARSTAAAIMARRSLACNYMRDRSATQNQDLTLDVPDIAAMTVYAPSTFLYVKDRTYAGLDRWNPGNYTVNIQITSLVEDDSIKEPFGPWRLTFLVYKAQGTAVTAHYPWRMAGRRAGPGEYILDASPTADDPGRGEAYLIDYVDNKNTPGDYSDDLIYVACSKRRNGFGTVTGSSLLKWYSFEGTVAAYHTIIGY